MAARNSYIILQVALFTILTALLFQIISGERGLIFLMVLLGGICALWLFKEPHWGVLLITSLWFLRFSPALLGVNYFRIPYLLSAILLIPLGVSILRDRDIWVWRVPQIKLLVAIGILFLASTGWSYYEHPVRLLPDLEQAGEMLQIFFVRLIFLLFFLYFITTSRKVEFLIWLLLGLIMASALSALYHLTEPGAGRAWAAFGPGTNPTSLPFLCLFGASLLWFYYSCAPSGYRRQLALVSLVPLPVVALASGSRGGLLQLVAFVAFIIKEQEGWSVAKKIRSLIFVGSVSFLFFSIIPAVGLLRATSFEATHSTGAGESLTNRINTVAAAFEMILSNPILGVGIGNFRWLHQIAYGSNLHPHNSYLGALLSGGIPCLALYSILFYLTYQMLNDLEKLGPRDLLWMSKALRINLILFLIASISDDIWLDDFLYLIVGFTVAMTRIWQSHYYSTLTNEAAD